MGDLGERYPVKSAIERRKKAELEGPFLTIPHYTCHSVPRFQAIVKDLRKWLRDNPGADPREIESTLDKIAWYENRIAELMAEE